MTSIINSDLRNLDTLLISLYKTLSSLITGLISLNFNINSFIFFDGLWLLNSLLELLQ